MIVDLAKHKDVRWYDLDEHEQAEWAGWWETVRARELQQLGVIGPDGLVRVRG